MITLFKQQYPTIFPWVELPLRCCFRCGHFGDSFGSRWCFSIMVAHIIEHLPPPLLSSSPRSCWIHPVTVRSHLIYHFISVHHPHLYHKKWSAIPQAMIISLLISPWFSHDFCRRKIPAEIHPDLDNFNANEAHQRQLHLFLQEAPDAPEPKPGRWRMAWDSMGNGKKWWFKSRKMVV